MKRILGLVATALIAVACTSDGPSSADAPEPSTAGPSDVEPSTAGPSDIEGADQEQRFPDVTAVETSSTGDGTRFDVTVSSPYDSPERYADAVRVRDAEGTVYGTRELTHDHADEQPFTRSLTISELPDAPAELVVEGRDQANGWGGGTQTVTVSP